MVKTLRESKARLSELVELASRGEDVLISVRGKIKVRLTRAGARQGESSNSGWVRDLKALHKAYGKGRAKLPIEKILAESRRDRI